MQGAVQGHILIPCLLLSVLTREQASVDPAQGVRYTMCVCMGAVLTSASTIFSTLLGTLWNDPQMVDRRRLLVAAFTVLLVGIFSMHLECSSPRYYALVMVLHTVIYQWLPGLFPGSFSAGEACIFAQILSLSVADIILFHPYDHGHW